MNDIRETLRINLEHQLKKSGLTQKQLAEQLGISPSAVTNWIRGKNSPDIEYIAIMCDIFNIGISDLLVPSTTKKAPALSRSDIQKQRLIENYEKLNPLGQEKLVDYSEDLTGNEKYTQTEAVFSAKEA